MEAFSKDSVRQSFAKAASSYDQAAVLQKEVLHRLISKFKVLRSEDMSCLLDIGSGTGMAGLSLHKLLNHGNYYAFDCALPMLQFARENVADLTQHSVCGDASSLPYKQNSFDVVFSASTYQWCGSLEKTFIDNLRVLKPQGLLIFSTFGPETLKELRHCFAQVDQKEHVSTFTDMHDIGDMMLSAGFHAPVIESEIITVEYSSPKQLLADLQATGATNHLQSRARGLMGKERLKNMLNEYEQFVLHNGKYPSEL